MPCKVTYSGVQVHVSGKDIIQPTTLLKVVGWNQVTVMVISQPGGQTPLVVVRVVKSGHKPNWQPVHWEATPWGVGDSLARTFQSIFLETFPCLKIALDERNESQMTRAKLVRVEPRSPAPLKEASHGQAAGDLKTLEGVPSPRLNQILPPELVQYFAYGK